MVGTSLKLSRRVDAAKRVGRMHSKYAFDISDLCATCVPSTLAGCELVVQFARSSKVAQCKIDVPLEGLPRGGLVNWGTQQLSFVATLYQSKRGKVFSDKEYKVSICSSRPAAFGTTKRSLRELASAELNVSEFVMNVDPQIHSIALQRRVKLSDEPPIELTFFIKATCVKGLTAGEDDSDRYSVSSMSRDTIGSESQSDAAALQSDQDLDGFDSRGATHAPVAGGGWAAEAHAQQSPCASASGFTKTGLSTSSVASSSNPFELDRAEESEPSSNGNDNAGDFAAAILSGNSGGNSGGNSAETNPFACEPSPAPIQPAAAAPSPFAFADPNDDADSARRALARARAARSTWSPPKAVHAPAAAPAATPALERESKGSEPGPGWASAVSGAGWASSKARREKTSPREAHEEDGGAGANGGGSIVVGAAAAAGGSGREPGGCDPFSDALNAAGASVSSGGSRGSGGGALSPRVSGGGVAALSRADSQETHRSTRGKSRFWKSDKSKKSSHSQDASPVSSAQAAAACLPPFPHQANSDDDDDLRVDSDASSADASNPFAARKEASSQILKQRDRGERSKSRNQQSANDDNQMAAEIRSLRAQVEQLSVEKQGLAEEVELLSKKLLLLSSSSGGGRVERFTSADAERLLAMDGGEPPSDPVVLSQELIQAKLEAAQFSLDRDEAKKKLREARDQTYEVQQQLNDLEEKHAELQRAYETDMNQFIEVKLKCAEAVSRVMQLEEELDSLQ